MQNVFFLVQVINFKKKQFAYYDSLKSENKNYLSLLVKLR